MKRSENGDTIAKEITKQLLKQWRFKVM